MVLQPGLAVRQAVEGMLSTLGDYTDQDWSRRAGTLQWTCWDTAAHVAKDLLSYAVQVTSQPSSSYLPLAPVVADRATPNEVLRIVEACGGILSTAVQTADPSSRAWHYGPTDPTGFEAVGVGEVILHTHDIADGLSAPLEVPASLYSVVLARLFPAAPPGDPVQVLLWATGRGELEGHPPIASWVWAAALSE